MREFQSQLEELMPAKELFFDATPGFGRYKPFLEQAIAHPAKMNVRLTEFLIETLTVENDVILDPMSGSGETGVVAALHGRNAVCVELEEKFYGWQKEAITKLDAHRSLQSKGRMVSILGDARKLSELLHYADAIVTSPPYSGSITGNLPKTEERAQRMIATGFDPKTVLGGKARNAQIEWRYTARAKKENIGNLTHGEIDAVITSPPFVDGFKHNPQDKEKRLQKLIEVDKQGVEKGQKWATTSKEALKRRLAMQDEGYGEKKDNIGNLPLGKIDAVITSPPYAELFSARAGGRQGHNPTEKDVAMGFDERQTEYSKDKKNIGNLPFDAVITSPPYEDTQHFHDMEFMKKITEDQNKKLETGLNTGHAKSVEAANRSFGVMAQGSLENKNNIGNLKKETYLEAMLKVYAEMWKVLKTDGLAIIAIKPFIRNKTVVDLPYQTWLLMQKCGFKLTKLFKLRLTQQSFWRILYRKKYPEVEIISHEYVLVCKK